MKILAAIGSVVIAIPFIIGLVLLFTLWSAWWLHPLWSLVIVPLGAPHISFWHFMALVSLIGVLTKQLPPADYARDESDEKLTRTMSHLAGALLSAPATYFYVSWLL